MIRKFTSRAKLSYDDSLRGWGWTPRTASWVEPTAFALMALSEAPGELLPIGARERRKVAKLLLYDRMCPGGGWDCGDPAVYGVSGQPLVEPTVWALLALRDEPHSDEKALSLKWLEQNLTRISGPGSLALAKICIEAYGRRWPTEAPSIANLYEMNEFLGNVPVMSWVCMALGERQGWLKRGVRGGG